MAVAWKELAGSPAERYDRDGMKATRTVVVNWSDRNEFMNEVLGTGYAFGGGAVSHYPDKENVFVIAAKCEPFTDDVTEQTLTTLYEDLNSYGGLCKVTLDYEAFDAQLPPDIENFELETATLLTYRCAGMAEANVITGGKWNSDSQDVSSDDVLQVQRIPVVEHNLTWHHVVRPPIATIKANVGKVNSAAWHGFAAQTILFDTYSIDREFVINADFEEMPTLWRVSYVFRERTVQLPNGTTGGWNYYYRTRPPDKRAWDVLLDKDGNPVYQTSSTLDNLFRYDTIAS